MRYFMIWLHGIQFSVVGIFALLVMYGSIPIRHRCDSFYLIYSCVLLALSISGLCFLRFRNTFSLLLMVISDILLPFVFFSFFLLLLPFILGSKMPAAIPKVFDAYLLSIFILWECVMATIAALTIKADYQRAREGSDSLY